MRYPRFQIAFPGDSVTKTSDRPERRRAARGSAQSEPDRAHLVALVLGTYGEMPGLALHLREAARLFGLREATCQVVLNDLVRARQLRQSADKRYRAVDGGPG